MSYSRPDHLDAPPYLSGVIPLVDSMTDDLAMLAIACPDYREQIENVRNNIGLLHRMYSRWAKENPPTQAELRFWARTHTNGTHLIWTGMSRSAENQTPVCNWTTNGRTIRTTASRVAWLLLRGQDVPTGTHLLRRCKITRCISPDCHDPTNQGKVMRSVGRPRKDIMYGPGDSIMCSLRGHVLAKPPKPGQKLYCPACHAMDKMEISERNKTRFAAERAVAASPDIATVYHAPTPIFDFNPAPTPTATPRLPSDIDDLFEQ